MSSNLFWALNSQIDRVCAEHDLRLIAIGQCSMNSDNAKKTVEKLNQQQGTIYHYGGGWVVEADQGAKEKLLSLMRK